MKNGDFVRSRLRAAGMGEKGLVPGGRVMALHAMATGCGWQHRRRGCGYDWDGLKRGRSEFALIQYTLRGWGMLDFEGVVRRVEPGAAMLLYFPHANRYWLPPESDGWEFVFACLNGRELLRVWRELVRYGGPLLTLDPRGEPVARLCDLYCRALAGGLDNPFDNSAAAYALAMSLARQAAPQVAAAASRPEPVRRALRLCQERLADPALDVADLARAAGLSRHHFSRVFDRAMGEAPAAYLKGMRLKESARLLQTSQLSVKEIAGACGFGDCSYFCRVFREVLGMAPGSFRRSGMFEVR